jgi:hypothetical protein
MPRKKMVSRRHPDVSVRFFATIAAYLAQETIEMSMISVVSCSATILLASAGAFASLVECRHSTPRASFLRQIRPIGWALLGVIVSMTAIVFVCSSIDQAELARRWDQADSHLVSVDLLATQLQKQSEAQATSINNSIERLQGLQSGVAHIADDARKLQMVSAETAKELRTGNELFQHSQGELAKSVQELGTTLKTGTKATTAAQMELNTSVANVTKRLDSDFTNVAIHQNEAITRLDDSVNRASDIHNLLSTYVTDEVRTQLQIIRMDAAQKAFAASISAARRNLDLADNAHELPVRYAAFLLAYHWAKIAVIEYSRHTDRQFQYIKILKFDVDKLPHNQPITESQIQEMRVQFELIKSAVENDPRTRMEQAYTDRLSKLLGPAATQPLNPIDEAEFREYVELSNQLLSLWQRANGSNATQAFSPRPVTSKLALPLKPNSR